MIDPVLVSVISATTALVASVTGPLVSLYVSRAQIRAAVRSGNRQRWIDEFRDLIANLSAQVATAVQFRDRVVEDGRVRIPLDPEFMHVFDRLVFTATKIRLMVNPAETEHMHLVKTIMGLLDRIRTASLQDDLRVETQATIGQIVEQSLSITRREWLRVQHGA